MTRTFMQRLRRHPVAVAVAVVIVLIAAAQFTDALGEIRQLAGRLGGSPPSIALPGGQACAADGGALAVRAYALALTNPTELGTFAQGNAASFAGSADAITCYRVLAAALGSNTNLSQLDALRDRAEAERETGLEFDRAAYTSDLAETLRELADALPALAKADDGPYRATKAYESAQAYSTLLQRAPGASGRIDTLVQADEDVLRALAARLSGR